MRLIDRRSFYSKSINQFTSLTDNFKLTNTYIAIYNYYCKDSLNKNKWKQKMHNNMILSSWIDFKGKKTKLRTHSIELLIFLNLDNRYIYCGSVVIRAV